MDNVSVRVEDGVAVLTIDNPPVNALKASVRAGIVEGIDRAGQQQDVKAVVLAAKGRIFVAGADITEFGKPPQSPTLREVIAALDQCRKPIVAAINGAALGGGLELAMGCHARIASPHAKLGLPEVKLGLLPGAGGTQRLPRLIGAEAALEMIVTGEPVSAQRALKLRLIDAIAEDDLEGAAIAHARKLAIAGAPLRRTRDLTPSPSDAAGRQEFEKAAAAALKRARGLPAPAACVEAVRARSIVRSRKAWCCERQAFDRLVQDETSKALRHAFFAERERREGARLSEGHADRARSAARP